MLSLIIEFVTCPGGALHHFAPPPLAAPPLPPLPPVPPPGLQSLLVQLLQQRVAFRLGRPDAVCTHDTGGPVAVEHQDQLLPLKLQLLYLGL